MNNARTKKKFDLEDRTRKFAINSCLYLKTIASNMYNIDYIKQLLRSSSSVGANYIEANESLSHKDFVYRLKIVRKEVKESLYWYQIIKATVTNLNIAEINKLIDEAKQLKNIFSSIIKDMSESS